MCLISLAIAICVRLFSPRRHHNSRECCNVSSAHSLFREWQQADQTRVREAIDTIPHKTSKRFTLGKNDISSKHQCIQQRKEQDVKSQTAFLNSARFCDISPENCSARLASSKRDRKYLRRRRWWSVCTCFSPFFALFGCLPR
jgi:hypothetical protein